MMTIISLEVASDPQFEFLLLTDICSFLGEVKHLDWSYRVIIWNFDFYYFISPLSHRFLIVKTSTTVKAGLTMQCPNLVLKQVFTVLVLWCEKELGNPSKLKTGNVWEPISKQSLALQLSNLYVGFKNDFPNWIFVLMASPSCYYEQNKQHEQRLPSNSNRLLQM